MTKPRADSILQIDLAALATNYQTLKTRAKRAETAAVVKANAYGLGADKVAKKLADEGCEHFFVATLEEGLALRKNLPKKNIYVFHGVQKHQEKEFAAARLIPVLNTLEQVKLWQTFAAKNSKKLPAILHVDTGMHRLGVSAKEAEALAQDRKFPALDLRYVMSHLACANTPSHPMNLEQMKAMNVVRKYFPKTPVSFANSAGIFLKDCYHFDLVRPGIALYGASPTDKLTPMKPVAHVYGRIIQLSRATQAGFVGYGASERVKTGRLLATVPVGYADGYLRTLSHKAEGYLHGRRVPLVGRVSMDLIVFDVTDIESVKVGDLVELMGAHITIDQLAKHAGTIGYELLTRLGQRFLREYRD